MQKAVAHPIYRLNVGNMPSSDHLSPIGIVPCSLRQFVARLQATTRHSARPLRTQEQYGESNTIRKNHLRQADHWHPPCFPEPY